VDPIPLPSNQVHRFYRGGQRIAELRGTTHEDDFAPEDWVGSMTATFGSDEEGHARLLTGERLSDVASRCPEALFGADHVARFGHSPALLVKLLDAGERLPVHCHPDRDFARRLLGSPFGKTEAWIILPGSEAGATVHLGFRRQIEWEELMELVAGQRTREVLAAINEFAVRPGDSVFVPGGTPHVIGEGIFLLELQEPTDLSILLEWQGFAIDGAAEGHLGLGFETALGCVDRSRWDGARLRRAVRSGGDGEAGVERLVGPEAAPYFGAERIRPDPVAKLEPAFSILVAIVGRGRLTTAEGRSSELSRGDAVLLPVAAGPCELSGPLEVIRCTPPTPEAALR
jgi:mannose-6-phosphate isomerase